VTISDELRFLVWQTRCGWAPPQPPPGDGNLQCERVEKYPRLSKVKKQLLWGAINFDKV
jgi:hypothetical protein